MTNRNETKGLFQAVVNAGLTVNQKYYVPKREGSMSMEGRLWRRKVIQGEWSQRVVKISKGRLSLDGGSAKEVESGCLWTKFDFMSEETPHLIVKIWEGVFKVEYGIPLAQLNHWIQPFLSLVGHLH